jgi:hypothetical protein
MSAELAMQKAVVAALADIGALAGVYDGPPPDAAAPYAVIGPDLVLDWSHKSGIGHEVRLLVTLWDDRPGGARLRALLGDVVARLRGLAGDWDGHHIVLARLQRAGVGNPEDGWRAASIEVRLLCEQL